MASFPDCEIASLSTQMSKITQNKASDMLTFTANLQQMFYSSLIYFASINQNNQQQYMQQLTASLNENNSTMVSLVGKLYGSNVSNDLLNLLSQAQTALSTYLFDLLKYISDSLSGATSIAVNADMMVIMTDAQNLTNIVTKIGQLLDKHSHKEVFVTNFALFMNYFTNLFDVAAAQVIQSSASQTQHDFTSLLPIITKLVASSQKIAYDLYF